MGHRKNKSGSGRKNGKEVAVSFVLENDDSTSGDEAASKCEKLLGNTDMLSEIFSRLPPQSVFRFRCISKSLYNFLGRAEFAALHSRNCKLVAGRAITGVFIQQIFYYQTSYYHILYDYADPGKIQFNNTIEWEAGELPDSSLAFLKQKSRRDKVTIMDSCNGLLLCASTTYGRNGKTFFVCNPLTRQKVALPHPRMPPSKSKSKSRKEEEVLYSSSFALMADLDHHHLKYKVVCLFWPADPGHDDNSSELVIWFSETGQWVELSKKLPPFLGNRFKRWYNSKVFFNGSLYWDCLEGHILVCPLNLKLGEPCYKLIDAPPAPKLRSLWKSEDKLHCYCQGFEDEFPEWTLSMNGEHESKWELRQDSEAFRNLTNDVSDQVAELYGNQSNTKPRIRLKIISYAPQSKAFFLSTRRTVYIYYLDERRLEYLGGFNPLEDTTFSTYATDSTYVRFRVFPYVHSMAHIQNLRVDHGADIGFETKKVRFETKKVRFETKKVRGRHNKRTPKCQDYSLEFHS